MGFQETQDLLLNTQYVYVKGRSFTTIIIEFYDKVTKDIDTGNITYIDFKKKF